MLAQSPEELSKACSELFNRGAQIENDETSDQNYQSRTMLELDELDD